MSCHRVPESPRAVSVAGALVFAAAAPTLAGFRYDVSPRDVLVLTGAPLALMVIAARPASDRR